MSELNTSVYPCCPACGRVCETVYFDLRSRLYVGCDVCLKEMDAWKCADCFPSDEDED